MSEPTLKPFTGKLDDNTNSKQQPALKPFTGALDGEDKGFLGQAKDHAVSFFGKGAVGVGEVAVGLSNMMSDGATGKILSEKLGYDPKAAKNVMTGWQSEQYQQQLKDSANIGNRKIEEGDDFATKVGKKFDNAVDITKNAISNPSLITNTVAESLPSMLLGGVLGRASGIANPVVAGAVGEGAVMAGSQAEQIRQEAVDGRLTADQSLASVGTGALGGLFGYAGGRLAQKMGLSDVDTAMQTGRLTTQQVGEEIAKTPMMAIPTAMIKGAISEGFLEELPQSVSEQILQNLALDKPWHDGVENAAVMGTLAGMAMGGTVSGVGKTGDWWNFRQDDIKRRNEIEALRRHGKLQEEIYQRSTAAQQETWNEQDLEAQQRLQDVYQERSRQAQNDAWIREDIQNHQRYLEQPIEQMGNLGNQIGTGVNPNNDPDAPITPNSPNPDDNSPNGNYFDDDYGSEAAFDDLLNAVPPSGQTPSQQMGINPNDGPMSSAAALAVDSGASPVAQLGYTPTQQTQEQSDTPISDAVPSNYQSLLGSQNDGQPFDARFEDATVQQGNTQADNAGESISQQYDANAADAMGGGIETDRAKTTTAQTVQPILGQDGKNKWFGNQDKAQAFLDKKNLGNDYHVVQNGRRFEIQPKPKSQDDAYFQSKLDDLDKQRAAFEAVGDDVNATNLYGEMQKVSREWQIASAKNQPATSQTPKKEYQKTESDKAWAEHYRTNRNMIGDDLFEGGHNDRNELENSPKDVQSRHAHGMAKATPAAAVRDLKDILENGIDQNRGQGRLFTAPLSQGKLTAEQRSAMSASGTSSGSAYSDGAFTLIAKEGVGDIRSVSEIDAVMVNSAVPQEVVNGLRQDFPDMKFGYAKELPSLLSGGKQSNNAQAQVAELEQQLKNEKSVPEKAQIRKQITELQNGLIEQAQGDVPPNNELQNADIKNLADSTQETTPPNAAPNIEDLVSVTTTDGETHMVLASELNDSNVKNLTKFSAQGKRVAVKLPRGRIASTSEQSQQPKQAEQPKVEANEQRESKIQSWINKWNQLKENGTASELDHFHKKVKIALNGYAQGKGVVAEFEQLKADIENFAKDYNKLPKTEQSTNTGPSAAETSTEQITAEIGSEATKTEATQKPKAEVSENRLVSDDRAAELRARLKAKLSQLNSGIDPEILAIGAELAVYHIERGARKFSAFAKNIANDLGVSVDKIRPYLRSWYNGARDMMEDMGADIQGMDSADTVRAELKKLDNSQQSDDEASRNKSDLQEDEVTNVEPSQKLKEMMERSKQRVHSSKQIIVDEHNFLNIGSSILTGQPVYTLWNDRGNYFTVDVDSIKPNATFNQVVIDKARAVKKQEEQRDAELVKKYPNGVFSGTDTQVVTTENVPKKVKEYLGSLLNMLGMDTKVFLATSQDINAQGAQEKYHIYGGHRSILSTQVNAEENGATRLISINQSDFNDAYIALNSGMSEETMIEVIAHELGHLIEKTLLKNASKETLDAIKADFQQWLASVKGVSKREHLALMRNRHIAQMNMQDKASIMDTPNANLSPYWFSFSEWFADQVSRWTTTSEKPLSLVEKFFASVAKKLKQLAQIVKNTKESYQPSVSVRDYLDGIARADFLEELYPQQSDGESGATGKTETVVTPSGREPVIVFHRSGEQDSFTVKTGYENYRISNGLFDGVFAGPNAGMGGKYKHAFALDPDKIMTHADFNYHVEYDDYANAVKELHPDWTDEQVERAWDYVAEDKEPFSEDEDDWSDLFGGDQAEASWKAQGLRGAIARLLGYQAVEHRDETGTSTQVLAGVKSIPLLEDESFNEAESRLYDEWRARNDNPDIRFSRQSSSDVINQLSKSFKQASAQSTNQWLKNKAKDTLGIALQALTRRQIMEVYGKLLPQLSRYNHIVELMDADATETSVNADNIVNEWAKLEDEQQLAELMHEATLAKIDPAKPFVSGSGTSISKYAQLLKAYNALTPEAQAMYVKARDAYSKHYADVHQAIKERILRSKLSNQKKTDLLKQMDDNFFAQSKGVYFPLSRFGKYVVVVRDANGVVESVNRAETLNEAEAVRIELQKQFPNSKVSPVTKDKEFNASRDGVGRGFMSELFKEAGNLGLSAKDQADFEDTLSQLYLASMPDLSWAKHGIHRKGMAGFSQNARRAFAQNMLHGGSYLAKLRYGDQLAEQLDDMQKHATNEGKKDDAYDQVTAQHVVDEMNSRHESYMNPNPHPVSTALTSLGFVYYLGLSPAAAMVNLSQTALVAYPLMGAKFGFKKSAAALKAAMADFAKGVDVENRNLDITKSLNTDEKKAYEEALRRGVIDKTQVHSLAGVAQGEDSGLSEKLKPIMKWSSFMFHHAERFNREVTFVAAYRLAKEHSIVENGKPRKLTKDEALEMAIDMTYKGHFDYSAGNRARIMQGNVAKVVLLFKQFAQNMIFTLMRQAYLSMYGMDVNERNEARKALAAILAFHGMAAGLLGLPIATSLVAASFLIAKKNPMLGMLFGVGAAAVFFGAGGDDDDPWDLEVEIRNYAAEVLGDDAANYLFKGAPRALGIDLSGRVGLDNLVIPKYQEGLEGQNLSNSVMAGALGPVAGIGANLFKGGQELGDGNLGRAMEAMLPVFMKNPIKAMRYADEGVQDKTGISIQDEVNAWGVFNQTIGFSPADVRLAYEGRSAIYQKKNRLTERRGELMSMWSRARKHDDQNAMDAIWEEIQAFNEINPKIRINRMQLMQSYRQRENRVNKSEDGIYVARKYEDSREAGAFAFGE